MRIWSLGGTIAFEVVKQLEEQEEAVAKEGWPAYFRQAPHSYEVDGEYRTV